MKITNFTKANQEADSGAEFWTCPSRPQVVTSSTGTALERLVRQIEVVALQANSAIVL